MKIKILAVFLIWFCVFESTVFAQKENYVWYFGANAGLDFNSGSPVAITNGVMNQLEGCASISDASGNFLFYTDGVSVWDNSHNIMPNGTLLGGGYSSTQSALIVPFPASNSLYYIFTVPVYSPRNFTYSVVNMSLNNGKGDITIKNNFLTSPVTEKLTAVKHINGNDIWVMVHGYNNNSFIVYSVTSVGISPVPVISNTGIGIFGDQSQGYMKFSPDGFKLAYASSGINHIMLFDFDPASGIVTNEKILMTPDSSAGYGLEFSPGGNYLYSSIGRFMPNGGTEFSLYQWDITSNIDSVINASQQIMLPAGGPYYSIDGLQLGPDGKIYVSELAEDSMGIINDPDMPGLLCNFALRAIPLNGKHSEMGLPNYITSYFLPTGINTTNPQPNQLTISPNPATDKIYISFPAIASENITTKIFSITGEVVFAEENKSAAPITKFQFPIFNILNGIYFLSVQTEKQFITKKIAVQH